MGPSPVNNWTEKKQRGQSAANCTARICEKNTYLAASQVSVYFFRSPVISLKTRRMRRKLDILINFSYSLCALKPKQN